MKTIKTLSSRIAALLLVVTVGITALPPAAVSMAAVPAARAGLGLPVEAVSAVWAASSGFGGAGRSGGGFGGMGGGSSHGGGAGRGH